MFVPIFLLSGTLKFRTSHPSAEFIADLSSIKYRTEFSKYNAIGQEESEGLKEPTLLVYKDQNYSFTSDKVNSVEESRDDGGKAPAIKKDGTSQNSNGVKPQRHQKILSTSAEKEKVNQATVKHDHKVHPPSRRITLAHVTTKLREMKDQIVKAKAYLNFAQANGNAHLIREIKVRIREVERAMGESTKESDLSKIAQKRMKSMELTLLKANRIYGDCSAMSKKLRAMTYNAEEQVRYQKSEETFLVQLASRTTPKGLHCLSMRLTSDYFALKPEEREIFHKDEVFNPDLYHFAVFSDNVLASAVVVESAISAAREPEKIVFHIVTDSLNYPAISMWFLLNRSHKSIIQVQSIDNFDWLPTKYNTSLQKPHNTLDPRYSSSLNHLRFYLPDIFPKLNKVVFLDHDVVVQKDLTKLWRVNMKGKVNGAVDTCQKDDLSYRKMNMLINFSDPMVSKRFDVKACTWGFGMNIFDLQEWRRQNLTETYRRFLQMGSKRALWKAGSLPLGWLTFYNQTVTLDRRWHQLGLGHHSGIRQLDIEQAAVIHFDGIRKPWLDIVIDDYKLFWRKHVNYDHPYLRQCNIQE
jgi:alpha-1,4-galacturonosyltransferase